MIKYGVCEHVEKIGGRVYISKESLLECCKSTMVKRASGNYTCACGNHVTVSDDGRMGDTDEDNTSG